MQVTSSCWFVCLIIKIYFRLCFLILQRMKNDSIDIDFDNKNPKRFYLFQASFICYIRSVSKPKNLNVLEWKFKVKKEQTFFSRRCLFDTPILYNPSYAFWWCSEAGYLLLLHKTPLFWLIAINYFGKLLLERVCLTKGPIHFHQALGPFMLPPKDHYNWKVSIYRY